MTSIVGGNLTLKEGKIRKKQLPLGDVILTINKTFTGGDTTWANWLLLSG